MKTVFWFVEANDESNRVYRGGPFATKAEAVSAAQLWIEDGSTIVSLRKMRQPGPDGIWLDVTRK